MRLATAVGLGLALIGASAGAQERFAPEKIQDGANLYMTYCMACHGYQMEHPGGSFDLRAFPPGEFGRFASSVTKGKNNMPPWGEVLQPGDLEALWAYVVTGEKK